MNNPSTSLVRLINAEQRIDQIEQSIESLRNGINQMSVSLHQKLVHNNTIVEQTLNKAQSDFVQLVNVIDCLCRCGLQLEMSKDEENDIAKTLEAFLNRS